MAIMTLTFFLSALHGYKSSMAEVQRLFDSELVDKARLLAIIGNGRSAKGEVVSVSEQYAFQIWQDGYILQRSDNTPLTAISNLEEGYQDTKCILLRDTDHLAFGRAAIPGNGKQTGLVQQLRIEQLLHFCHTGFVTMQCRQKEGQGHDRHQYNDQEYPYRFHALLTV